MFTEYLEYIPSKIGPDITYTPPLIIEVWDTATGKIVGILDYGIEATVEWVDRGVAEFVISTRGGSQLVRDLAACDGTRVAVAHYHGRRQIGFPVEATLKTKAHGLQHFEIVCETPWAMLSGTLMKKELDSRGEWLTGSDRGFEVNDKKGSIYPIRFCTLAARRAIAIEPGQPYKTIRSTVHDFGKMVSSGEQARIGEKNLFTYWDEEKDETISDVIDKVITETCPNWRIEFVPLAKGERLSDVVPDWVQVPHNTQENKVEKFTIAVVPVQSWDETDKDYSKVEDALLDPTYSWESEVTVPEATHLRVHIKGEGHPPTPEQLQKAKEDPTYTLPVYVQDKDVTITTKEWKDGKVSPWLVREKKIELSYKDIPASYYSNPNLISSSWLNSYQRNHRLRNRLSPGALQKRFGRAHGEPSSTSYDVGELSKFYWGDTGATVGGVQCIAAVKVKQTPERCDVTPELRDKDSYRIFRSWNPVTIKSY